MFRKQPSRPAAVREGGHSIAGGEASATSWAVGPAAGGWPTGPDGATAILIRYPVAANMATSANPLPYVYCGFFFT